jgi:hypothetical protein
MLLRLIWGEKEKEKRKEKKKKRKRKEREIKVIEKLSFILLV